MTFLLGAHVLSEAERNVLIVSFLLDPFTLSGSLLTSPPHDLHRKRRAALNPFFSQQSTRRLLPLLQERIDVLVAKLEELKDTGKAVNLLHAFSALANGKISFTRCNGI